jgi:hypothetical protein
MKQLFILVLSLFLTVSVLNAKKKTSDGPLLHKLVEEVKQSKGDERRKAMNALKVELRSMNQETRRQVMMNLQKNFSHGNQGMHSTAGQHLQKHQGGNRTPGKAGSSHISPASIPQQQHSPHTQPPNMIPGSSSPGQHIPSQQHPNFGQAGGHR